MERRDYGGPPLSADVLTVIGRRRAPSPGPASPSPPVTRNGRSLTEAEAQREQLALEAWPEPVFLLDDDDRVIVANPAAVDLTGRDLEELAGSDFLALVDPDDRARLAEVISSLRAGSQPERMEARLDTPTHDQWVEILASDMRALDVVGGLIVHASDCTARKKAEFQASLDAASAREADRRYRVAFQTTVVGMATTDIDGLLTNVNESLGRLLGEGAGALMGRHLSSLVVPEERYAMGRTIAQLLANDIPGPHQSQTVYLTTAGDRVVTETALVPIYDDRGHPLSLMVFVNDETARTAALEALQNALSRERQALVALQQLEETKSQLLAAVSHDFRTPLAAISGFTHLLVEEWDTFEAAVRRDMAERVRRNANELDRRVTEFLEVARAGTADEGPLLEPCDLGEVVDEAVQRSRFILERHKLEVTAPPVLAVSDARAVSRIVENLLGNAAKYTPEGTTVRVVVRAVDATTAVVSVSDEGPGIPEEDREKVFKPFVRLNDSAGRAWGAGVGLPGSRSLAERLGGSLAVEEAEGTGSRFVLTVPRGEWSIDDG